MNFKVKCRIDWIHYQSKCLKVFVQAVGPLEAKQTCERNGATLISIYSAEENEFIFNLLQSDSYPNSGIFWLGGRRNGPGIKDFEWQNGKVFNFTNFGFPPDNWKNNENFVEMVLWRNGSWNDISDSHKNPFICERDLLVDDE